VIMKGELVANFWPVVDGTTGLIQRVLARAYVVAGGDAAISGTLSALAPDDFRLARAFPIPARFELVTEHGTLKGCVSLERYQQHEFAIIEPIIRALESGFAKLQGINVDSKEPVGLGLIPRFPQAPYIITTFLLEAPDGTLTPQFPG